MKEAAGEANMTVITIVLIAIVLGIGTLLIDRLMSSTTQKACCADAGGEWTGGQCQGDFVDMATYDACLGDTDQN